MKPWIIGTLGWVGLMVWVPPLLADCDLTRFPWGCDRFAYIHAKPYVSSLVYCQNTSLYVTHETYDVLTRYQKDNVMFSVLVNEEFIEGPCFPVER